MTNPIDIKPIYRRKVFRVAPYTVYHATDGDYWLEHDDGGGGHLTRVAMGKMLDEFWKAKR